MNGQPPIVELVRQRYPSFLSPRFDLGQIVSDTFLLLRNGFNQFLAIFIVIHVPLILVQQLVLPAQPEIGVESDALLRFFFSGIFFSFLGMFVTLNLFFASRFVLQEKPKPFYEIVLHSIVRFPTAVFAMLIFMVTVGVGILALIIPGIILAVFGSVFLQSIALGDKGIFSSLAHSVELVRGNWWRVLLFYLLIVAAYSFVALPLGLVSIIAEPGFLFEFVGAVFLGFIGLLANLAGVMLYYNLLGILNSTRASGMTSA